MKSLDEKIKKSIQVINKARAKFSPEKTVIAWTGGKDSTVLLYLVKMTFNNTVPFPVMFNDSTMEFEEVYEFIKKLEKEWNLNLVIVPHSKIDIEKFHFLKNKEEKKNLSRIMKVNAIKSFVANHKIEAFMAGIRWDEHEARSKETYFSEREDHTRVHPILHFTEEDIWDYIHRFDIPYVELYDKGYRSLGEKPFTKKAIPGQGERSGREHDKEIQMQKLRNMGYW